MSARTAAARDIALDMPRIGGWVFDLDGTLAYARPGHTGYDPIPGAIELVAALRARATPFILFTNGSFALPDEYVEQLRGVGFDLEPGDVMTPTSVAVDFFLRRKARRILVLGDRGVWAPMRDAGLDAVLPPDAGATDSFDAVYVGWHPGFGLDDLKIACDAVWAGARLYVSSLAPFFTGSGGGRMLGLSNAIAAAIRSTTGARATLLGKPSPHAIRAASRRLGVPVPSLCVVGDDPRLEPAMARKAGAYAVGVASGLWDAEAFAALPEDRRPHAVFDSVAGLRGPLAGTARR